MAYDLFIVGGQQAGHCVALLNTAENAAAVEAAGYLNNHWNQLWDSGAILANMGDASKIYKYTVDRGNKTVAIASFVAPAPA